MGPEKEVSRSIVLRQCLRLENLKVGGGLIAGWFRLQRHRRNLVELVCMAGFTCFGSGIQRYSRNPRHGFTLVVTIGQSAIVFHTYPEYGTVTALAVTCSGEDSHGFATRKLKQLLARHFVATEVESKPLGSVPLQRVA